ncbi:L-rhamnose mutarotase [Algibacter lectus]|uniref:L-fucose mutarotase n=1 Tax=Algibacter lectus TaxID=221126 RepID=A0A090X5H1_9FLAO|nr:L-rhamnose mutarotase [Algibacter lectus]MDO7135580.1 L-rhamnose mutarotase [Algibacter lectus]GAL79522.1 L-fucose mutarotase [Algibacter lectus]
MKKHCFALDLVDDAKLIEDYKVAHQKVWPEIIKSIKDSGIEDLEIYLVGNRLFMIMVVNDSFSFEQKNAMDTNNPKVQEWETLMWNYQQALPMAKEGEKWMLMEKIFQL